MWSLYTKVLLKLPTVKLTNRLVRFQINPGRLSCCNTRGRLIQRKPLSKPFPEMGTEASVLKGGSEGNPSKELFDTFQPQILQNRDAGQEDFCDKVNIELVAIKGNRQSSTDSKVENPFESGGPPRFFCPSGSFASFGNNKLATREKKVEEVNGTEEALVNDRSALALFSFSCFFLFLILFPLPCSFPHVFPPPCSPILIVKPTRWRLSHVVYIANDGVYLYRKWCLKTHE